MIGATERVAALVERKLRECHSPRRLRPQRAAGLVRKPLTCGTASTTIYGDEASIRGGRSYDRNMSERGKENCCHFLGTHK